MKLFIAALISATLFILAPQNQSTPVNNSEPKAAQTAKADKLTQVKETDAPVAETIAKIEVRMPEVQPEPIVIPEPVSHPIGCENYRQLISQYDWNVEVALQISQAESGCNPTAVGDQFAINGLYAPSCGLFQVRTLSSRPSCEALKDPATNIEWAYRIYQGQGYNAWSVCKTKVSCW